MALEWLRGNQSFGLDTSFVLFQNMGENTVPIAPSGELSLRVLEPVRMVSGSIKFTSCLKGKIG